MGQIYRKAMSIVERLRLLYSMLDMYEEAYCAVCKAETSSGIDAMTEIATAWFKLRRAHQLIENSPQGERYMTYLLRLEGHMRVLSHEYERLAGHMRVLSHEYERLAGVPISI